MVDTSDEALIADIATLARQSAEQEPFNSLSGPDALRAFASRLEAMLAAPPNVVQVAVRRARTKT